MSEVKRYHVTDAGLVEGQALGRINVVLGPYYDSAVQCFLTAAEGCVAAERRERALQALLTAADARVDALEGVLREAGELFWAIEDDLGAGSLSASAVGVIRTKIDAALNQGARTNTSGKAHCPHDGICHTSDETCAEARARIASLNPAVGGGDE